MRACRMASSQLRFRAFQKVPPGFSLVEILIVMTVMALLLTLAAPSYLGVQLRINRTEAASSLMNAATCQERIRAIEGFYDTRRCLPVDTHHYRYRFDPEDSLSARNFTAFADPKGKQTKDDCGSLGLNEAGAKSAGGSEKILDCWSGR